MLTFIKHQDGIKETYIVDISKHISKYNVFEGRPITNSLDVELIMNKDIYSIYKDEIFSDSFFVYSILNEIEYIVMPYMEGTELSITFDQFKQKFDTRDVVSYVENRIRSIDDRLGLDVSLSCVEYENNNIYVSIDENTGKYKALMECWDNLAKINLLNKISCMNDDSDITQLYELIDFSGKLLLDINDTSLDNVIFHEVLYPKSCIPAFKEPMTFAEIKTKYELGVGDTIILKHIYDEGEIILKLMLVDVTKPSLVYDKIMEKVKKYYENYVGVGIEFMPNDD